MKLHLRWRGGQPRHQHGSQGDPGPRDQGRGRRPGRQGMWKPATTGYTPDNENEFMKRYLPASS